MVAMMAEKMVVMMAMRKVVLLDLILVAKMAEK